MHTGFPPYLQVTNQLFLGLAVACSSMGPTHYVLCDLVQQVPGSSPGCDMEAKGVVRYLYPFLCSSRSLEGAQEVFFLCLGQGGDACVLFAPLKAGWWE